MADQSSMLGPLMQWLMANQAAQPGMPPGPSSPAQANPQQLGGQGVLGQGLANQAQQIDQATGVPPPPGQPQQAPPSQSGPPPTQLSPMQASPNIRPWAFTHLDPKDWTAEEHDLFAKLHNIPQQQNQGPLAAMLQAIGIGNTTASK